MKFYGYCSLLKQFITPHLHSNCDNCEIQGLDKENEQKKGELIKAIETVIILAIVDNFFECILKKVSYQAEAIIELHQAAGKICGKVWEHP